jgi:hypothetical protein
MDTLLARVVRGFEGGAQINTAYVFANRGATRLGRHNSLNGRPRQPSGKHRQRALQIDHLIQPRAKKVRCAHCQIPQESDLRYIKFEENKTQTSGRIASIYGGSRRFAGPTSYAVSAQQMGASAVEIGLISACGSVR